MTPSRRPVPNRALLLATLLATAGAGAQDYPTRHVTILVGFTAGGAADLVARNVSTELGKLLGQQVVVENRPGAGGTIAAETVARAAANGYTLLCGGMGPNATAHTLYPKLKYDSAKDFAPVSLLAENPNVLVVHPSIPARNVAEFLAAARRTGVPLMYASAGNGSAQHVAAELLRSMAKLRVSHVPYKGIPEGLGDVISGQLDFMFPSIFNAVPLAKSGKVRALAVTTRSRSPIVPDLPTIDESGVPGYEQVVWHALLAPAGTPPAVVARLNEAVRKALAAPDIARRLAGIGATPAWNTPEDLGRYVRAEIDKWGRIIRESGAKLD
ncbi:MAG: tripartite tricarboxylate transporter substrate binding protein [Gammaproteobacteria bacterium]|nr:tripartite tricarboxylate transporter substrate binding protein [Gammaproteobacteria bacterium]